MTNHVPSTGSVEHGPAQLDDRTEKAMSRELCAVFDMYVDHPSFWRVLDAVADAYRQPAR